MTPLNSAQTQPARAVFVLVAGAWFGLVAGLLEGLAQSGLQWAGLLTWKARLSATSIKILWIAPLLYLVGFLVLAALLLILGRILPLLPIQRIALLSFSFLAFVDLISVTGRVGKLGVAVLSLGLAVGLTRWWSSRLASAELFLRRSLPFVFGLTLVALVAVEGGLRVQEWRAEAQLPAAPATAPNVLLIVVDTLRADHVSSCGYARVTTPTLDRLAEKGVLFDNAISPSSWTLPAHVSLLTGRLPSEHGAEMEKYDGRFPLLAEMLRRRGYRTGAFSANTVLFTRTQGFGRGFIRFEDYFGTAGDMVARTFFGRQVWRRVLRPLGWEDFPGRKRAPDVTRAAVNWVERDSQRPFFAVLNYFDLHDPYLPPQPYRSRFSKQANPGGVINSHAGRDYPKMTPEQLQGEIDAYDGAIAFVDQSIDDLLKELRATKVDRETIVLVTSDHGESFSEHGLFGHANALYRELIRVPVIVYGPGLIPSGIRVKVPVSLADVPATVMDLIDPSNETVFPGSSLARLWDQRAAAPDWLYPISELAKMPFGNLTQVPNYHGAMKSVVSPRWHYIAHEKFGETLYDWEKDPAEENDLAGTPEGEKAATEMAEHLRRVLRNTPHGH